MWKNIQTGSEDFSLQNEKGLGILNTKKQIHAYTIGSRISQSREHQVCGDSKYEVTSLSLKELKNWISLSWSKAEIIIVWVRAFS